MAEHSSHSDPTEAMMGLRLMVLQRSPAEFQFQPTTELPRVYGVLMDWPTSGTTVSVVSLCDGTTSLYTTTGFGILGGGFHESVTQASRVFLHWAEVCYEDTLRTDDLGYPPENRLRFYLMCYDGLRMFEETEDALMRGRNPRSALAGAAQDVITALREIHEQSATEP